MVTMVRLGALTFIITTVVSIEDTFHYGITEGSKYGPSDWGEVQCDTDTCVSCFVGFLVVGSSLLVAWCSSHIVLSLLAARLAR
jgi:hypothetical protein